jgi:hypothetical protein
MFQKENTGINWESIRKTTILMGISLLSLSFEEVPVLRDLWID